MEPIVNMDRYQIQNQPTNDYVKEYFNPIWDGAEKILNSKNHCEKTRNFFYFQIGHIYRGKENLG